MTFEDAFAEVPIIAILRGVMPNEVEPIAGALYQAGVRIIEVPLNSPQPLVSIQRLAASFSGKVAFGAGTVRTIAEVQA
jgi:2-dehydro-3-deoxyphosphogalactonate aldolase